MPEQKQQEFYYFDRDVLMDFLNSGFELKVYVDRDYLIVNSKSDLYDYDYGLGYDEFGEAFDFAYIDIEQVMLNSEVYTVEMLKQDIETAEQELEDETPEEDQPEEEEDSNNDNPEQSKDKESSQDDNEEEPQDDGGEEEAPPEEEEPESPNESIRVGKRIQNLNEKSYYYGETGYITEVFSNYVKYQFYSTESKRLIVDTISKRKLAIID